MPSSSSTWRLVFVAILRGSLVQAASNIRPKQRSLELVVRVLLVGRGFGGSLSYRLAGSVAERAMSERSLQVRQVGSPNWAPRD